MTKSTGAAMHHVLSNPPSQAFRVLVFEFASLSNDLGIRHKVRDGCGGFCLFIHSHRQETSFPTPSFDLDSRTSQLLASFVVTLFARTSPRSRSSAQTATSMQDLRSSFLHLPIELRILILRHVFAESKVVIGARYRPCWQDGYSKLETGILLTCKQLHKEGQELLASSTRLEVYYKGYSFDRIPNNVCLDYEYVRFIKHLTLLIGYYDTEEFCFQPQQLPGLEFLQLIGLCENHDETVGSSALSLGEWNDLMQGSRDRLIIDTLALSVETREGIPNWLADYVRKPANCPFEIIIQYTDRTRFEIRQEDASAGPDTATHRKTVILELHFNALTREVVYRKCLNDDYHGSGLCPKRYLVDRWLLEKHEDGETVDSGRSEYGFVYDDWVIGLEDNPWAGLEPRFPNRHLAAR